MSDTLKFSQPYKMATPYRVQDTVEQCPGSSFHSTKNNLRVLLPKTGTLHVMMAPPRQPHPITLTPAAQTLPRGPHAVRPPPSLGAPHAP